MVPFILSFLIVLVIAGVAGAIILSQQAARKKRIASVIQGQKSDTGGKRKNKHEAQNKRRDEISKKLKENKASDPVQQDKKKKTIGLMLQQAGLNISTRQYWIFSAVAALVLVLLAQAFGYNVIIVIMAGIIGFFGIPRFTLKIMAGKRQKKFLEEFPDALEATVRLLKAGMPVSEAVKMISKEFTGPVGEEMSRIYDQQKIGVPLHEAALEATRRMPLTEMQMFATGMAIQAQTGASLSEVLTNLANVIRARFRLKRKVKALSSEAIVSACIIGALPNFVALGLYFANREYLQVLFDEPFGRVMLAGAVIWMCIGIVIMRAMINFKV